ncbi:hypothetical protein ACO229_06460 [Promicromonospora sp. MS192]|uniref:hypothetical protein n=1 Tax=Promicromonospora sp. MS192 TaxID=3412684 RepID=UPI003C2C33D3
MNGQRVPVALPRARFDIDTDGHLAVTVDGQPWQPPSQVEGTTSTGPGLRLGRSDVPWVQQQIADDLGTPVLVEVVDDGQPYTDIVDPGAYHPAEPDRPSVSAEVGVGRYRPGEPVVISVVVARTHADEHGHVHYRLPAALGDRAVLVHGQHSGTTLPLNASPVPWPSTGSAEASSRSPFMGRDRDAHRRQPCSGPARRPAMPEPTSAPRVTPDDGLGAL